jgi:hypothetical protein
LITGANIIYQFTNIIIGFSVQSLGAASAPTAWYVSSCFDNICLSIADTTPAPGFPVFTIPGPKTFPNKA